MTLTYQTFLETPTAAGFARLQRDLCREEDFRVDGAFVARLARLWKQGRYEELRSETAEMPYAWIASPAVHLLAALVAEKFGDHEEVELERFLCETMLQGLAESGNGTRKAPYRLTYLTDAADLLAYFSLTPEKRRLVRATSGHLDVVRTTTGDEICFLLPSGSVGQGVVDRPEPVLVPELHFRMASSRFSAGRSPW
ncbi:MAG: hypothetical protein WDZ51_05940 [Pirellulaceae bacterium]